MSLSRPIIARRTFVSFGRPRIVASRDPKQAWTKDHGPFDPPMQQEQPRRKKDGRGMDDV
jgi:hypothetical protein